MTDPTPAALAEQAAEAIRALNRSTFAPDPTPPGYTEPAEVAATVASLRILADRLPQALRQASQWLADQDRAGRLLAASGAAIPAPQAAGFEPIPGAARDTAAQALADEWPEWDADTYCNAPFDEHDHENCYPTAWWPGREQVSAAVIRGLVDAGWTLTPPGGGT